MDTSISIATLLFHWRGTAVADFGLRFFAGPAPARPARPQPSLALRQPDLPSFFSFRVPLAALAVGLRSGDAHYAEAKLCVLAVVGTKMSKRQTFQTRR